MWTFISRRLDAQSAIISTFAASLVLSLACSLSIQAGHAETTVAATAEAIHPRRAGEPAPAEPGKIGL